MTEETIAERIERRVRDYGELLKAAGMDINHVCVAAGGEVERGGNGVWYYAFPDGSCLQGGTPGWTIHTWDRE